MNTIVCPNCSKKNTWQSDNAYRPFCSERCRLIDLGEWAEERYAIPIIHHTEDYSSNEDSLEIKNQ